MKMQVRSLASLRGLRIWHCRELWCSGRCSSDLAFLWLWCRPVTAAPIQPLAWEPPYATGAALKRLNKSTNQTLGVEFGRLTESMRLPCRAHTLTTIWRKFLCLARYGEFLPFPASVLVTALKTGGGGVVPERGRDLRQVTCSPTVLSLRRTQEIGVCAVDP